MSAERDALADDTTSSDATGLRCSPDVSRYHRATAASARGSATSWAARSRSAGLRIHSSSTDAISDARERVLREFDVENRLEGTAGFLTVSFPIFVNAAPAKPVVTKY